MNDEWRERAACRNHDPESWFADSPFDLAHAVSVCLTECPVKDACEAYRQQTRPAYGVWGGKVCDRTKDKNRIEGLTARVWAVRHGYADHRLLRSGRLPKEIRDAYKAAKG